MTGPALHLMVPGPLDQVSGGYRYDRRLVDGLRARDWTVTVHSLPGRYPLANASTIMAADIALSRLPDRAVVLVDGLALPGLAGAMALDSHRLRLIGLVHHPLWLEGGLDEGRSAALRRLETGALACTRRVLVPSRATAGDLVAMGVPEDAIAVVSPGTDSAPAAAGSGQETPSLLAVGMVVPRKGHLTLVAALAALADRPWRLTLVGSLDRDPAHVGTVRDAIVRAGLEDRVALPGAVSDDDLADAFHGADLFVQPSRHEGYGMALAEALARGLPIVSTAVGAAPDLLAGGAGVVVPVDDPVALAAALGPLLTDAGERRRLADATAAAARRLPAWNGVIDRFAAELAALIPI